MLGKRSLRKENPGVRVVMDPRPRQMSQAPTVDFSYSLLGSYTNYRVENVQHVDHPVNSSYMVEKLFYTYDLSFHEAAWPFVRGAQKDPRKSGCLSDPIRSGIMSE